ncbi:MAG: prolipoprotein diacylglyceryl transferase [Pseudomonadota bacterium]
MWPDLFHVSTSDGSFPLHTWGLMITLAFLAAAGVTQTRAKAAGIDADKLPGLYLVAFVCGLAGARLLHFTMAEPERFFHDPLVFFRVWEGGFAFYGGVLLAVVGCFTYALLLKMPVWKLADLTSPAIMLGLALGRIGCFSAGCCHGAVRALPAGAVNLLPDGFSGGRLWAFGQAPFLLTEPFHGVGINHQPLLPTQLWASAAALCLFLLLAWRWRNRRYDGQVFAWLLLTYPLVRSTIEHFRGDTIRGLDWLGLFTTSQLVSIPVFVAGLVLVLVRRRSGLAAVERRDEDADLLEELRRER